MDLLERPEWRLGAALVIGLLIGAEREQRKGADDPHRAAAGVRTFAIAALLGGVLPLLNSPLLAAVGFAVLGILVCVAYVLGDRTDPGITTEVALILTVALGAFAQTEPLVALALGATVSFLLAMRTPLHHVFREVISERELTDALTFCIAAVVVLPLVPNQTVDPWGAINPFVMWRLAVIIMAITGLGYVLLRWVGPRYGLFIAGLASGFISSSATIGSMGARAKENSKLMKAAGAGAAASTVATFVQLGLLVTVANPALGRRVMPSVIAGGVVALAFGLLEGFRASRVTTPKGPPGRPFRWRVALLFVSLVAVVTLGSVLLQRALGDTGVFLGAGLAGLADAHAAASGVAAATADGQLSFAAAHTSILIGVSANTLTKILFAFSSGPRPFAIRITIGLLLALGAAWGGLRA